jgi:hypothetical protein
VVVDVAPAPIAHRGARAARLIAWVTVVPIGAFIAVIAVTHGLIGRDSHAYWLTGHRPDLYGAAPAQPDAYLYSPAFAQLIRPLTWLPWPMFAAVWFTAELTLVAWLLRPLSWGWRVPLFALCIPELYLGNVHLVFALVLVLGFSRPGLWAVPLLTKVTPGAGLLWFAARREWRHLATAASWTLGVVAVSFAISPSAWVGWVRFLAHSSTGNHPIWQAAHLTAGAVLLVYAIVKREQWLLAPALVLLCPVLTYLAPLAILAALPRILRKGENHPGSNHDRLMGADPIFGAVRHQPRAQDATQV